VYFNEVDECAGLNGLFMIMINRVHAALGHLPHQLRKCDRPDVRFRALARAIRNLRLGLGVAATRPINTAIAMHCLRTSTESNKRNAHSITPVASSGFANTDSM